MRLHVRMAHKPGSISVEMSDNLSHRMNVMIADGLFAQIFFLACVARIGIYSLTVFKPVRMMRSMSCG